MAFNAGDIVAGLRLAVQLHDYGFNQENAADVRYKNFRNDIFNFRILLERLEQALQNAQQRYDGSPHPMRIRAHDPLSTDFEDERKTIVGNCDTTLFLGGKEKTTLKEISEILGKETIDSFNTSETRGRELSHGLNYQKLGKQLMTEDEIAVMDGGKCILQLRGVRPFFSDKYDITKHPKYRYRRTRAAARPIKYDSEV